MMPLERYEEVTVSSPLSLLRIAPFLARNWLTRFIQKLLDAGGADAGQPSRRILLEIQLQPMSDIGHCEQ